MSCTLSLCFFDVGCKFVAAGDILDSAFPDTVGSGTKGSGTKRNRSDANESLPFRHSSNIGSEGRAGFNSVILCLIAHSASVVETLVPRKYASIILSLPQVINKNCSLQVKFTS